MRISTRGHYGLRMMVGLAAHYGTGLLKLSDIAKDLGIPPKYLHALLTMLKSAGLLRSQPGTRGGYELARPPAEIRVSEVIHVLEGFPTPVKCVADGACCNRSSYCAAHTVWCDLAKAIEKVLSEITLADLVAREKLRLAPLLTFEV
jgi:Rrf2 family transcriptional regulator, cysteine metabolism repressor